MIPRTKFACLPTPIEMLPRLSSFLGGPNIWVKRDDQTGLATGGNKTRKLEFVLAEAQANGARTLISVGAIQSNHCRQTAAMAAKFGFDCILVLSGDEPGVKTGNLLLDHLFGAEIVWTTRDRREQTLKEVFDQAWADGRRPHLIPLGASDPTGTMGYRQAFFEAQESGLEFDWMVFASSSGGTHAGLALGAAEKNWQGKVLGISIDAEEDELKQKVAGLVNAASDKYSLGVKIEPMNILVNADYLGAGYAILGEPEKEAIRLFARMEGLLLDPVYSGRAAAGMIDLIRKGYFRREDRVLFWHTGGQAALFAETYAEALSE
ncbi:MAG: D-cysteine desulfhydrase family protein [Anaerolineaceae bacterium]|nr:D-cysteine desulfhydrase family protein [Anaerolineaceae bacterium]